jgi:hypothetical protein
MLHFFQLTSNSNKLSFNSSFVGLIINFQSLYHIFAAPTGQSKGIQEAIIESELPIIVATHKSIC